MAPNSACGYSVLHGKKNSDMVTHCMLMASSSTRVAGWTPRCSTLTPHISSPSESCPTDLGTGGRRLEARVRCGSPLESALQLQAIAKPLWPLRHSDPCSPRQNSHRRTLATCLRPLADARRVCAPNTFGFWLKERSCPAFGSKGTTPSAHLLDGIPAGNQNMSQCTMFAAPGQPPWPIGLACFGFLSCVDLLLLSF